MKYQKFDEYLNSKGKIETGVTDIHGDRVDPMTPPNKPPKENGNKPYCNSDGKDAKKKADSGLGDEGDKDLKYEPDTGKDSKKPASIPTAESFASYELVPLMCESIEKHPSTTENFVRSLKRKGALGILVGELMEHRETYQHMLQILNSENGATVRKKLEKLLDEEVSPSYASRIEDEDLQKTSLEDVEIDDDTDELDVSEEDDFSGEEDLELDDMMDDEMGDQQQFPSFKQAMMSRM